MDTGGLEKKVIPASERKVNFALNNEFVKEQKKRSWLINRGKQHRLDFLDSELRQLKKYFMQLDEDGGGTISAYELEGPLIGMGFAHSRQQIKEMVQEVDYDCSG